MRAIAMATTALALTLVTGGLVQGVAAADDGTTPSRRDVQEARGAVQAKADDVESVRAALVVANQRLEQSAMQAGQAAEAFNGARWKATQAREKAAAAQRRSDVAAADVARQRAAYGDAIVTSYELAPGLTSLSAIVRSDGLNTVLQRTATMQNAEDALDGRYDEFRASATLADVASDQADDAEKAAAKAEQQARDARATAQAAADAAASEASSIADEKDALVAQLAELQHTSVQLAQRRQSALEAKAAAAAAAAAEHEQQLREQREARAEAKAEAEARAQAEAQAQAQAQQSHSQGAASQPSHHSPNPPSQPDPPADPAPPAPPAPSPPSPPAPAGGVQAALSFARSQIGEPYVWGAAGPSAWDCSGLTMGAWAAGGKYLPHYSVAQYEQSTPISAGQLRPGDLVFWGSSSSPGSIYHVAIYSGNGMIIQAPRTGRDVEEVSMYYWIAPNFYARP